MYTVLFYFSEESPDTEDEAVRVYLTEHQLEPRRQTNAELDDHGYTVWSFGGCYLGRAHLNAIADLQGKVVEREMLTIAI